MYFNLEHNKPLKHKIIYSNYSVKTFIKTCLASLQSGLTFQKNILLQNCNRSLLQGLLVDSFMACPGHWLKKKYFLLALLVKVLA